MNKPITEIDDPRLVKALAHPLRIRIMSALERSSATPKQIAQALDVPLENLSYHVRALRDFGFIKLEDRRMVRGAVEHRYSLAARPRITAKAWENLPAVVREALDAASLSQIWEIVAQAAIQGKMDRPESHVARQFARLDEQGFAEASALVTETLDRLAKIEKQSARRLRRHNVAEVPTMLIAMLFDAPDMTQSSHNARPRRGRRKATASRVSH
jgi:DNA-binding transcriptional ArsR family regulator